MKLLASILFTTALLLQVGPAIQSLAIDLTAIGASLGSVTSHGSSRHGHGLTAVAR